jgi:hypothetical protein
MEGRVVRERVAGRTGTTRSSVVRIDIIIVPLP